ncbi:MAG: type II toxin-antitoxin system HigB family toxin [Ignavibacteria bacterium]|jgi:mRNA interferase HigB
MHIIITRKRILEFSKEHPDSAEPLKRWYRIVKHTNYSSFTELRKTFPHADQVDRFTVFNIGGNKFRLISYIVYTLKRIYIRHILTHTEYNKGKWKEQK